MPARARALLERRFFQRWDLITGFHCQPVRMKHTATTMSAAGCHSRRVTGGDTGLMGEQKSSNLNGVSVCCSGLALRSGVRSISTTIRARCVLGGAFLLLRTVPGNYSWCTTAAPAR